MSSDSQQPFAQPYGPPKTFAPQEMPPELVSPPADGQAPPSVYGQAPPPPGYAPAGTPQYALPGYPPPSNVPGGYPAGYPGGQVGGFLPALAPWRVRFGSFFVDYLVTVVIFNLARAFSRITAVVADPAGYGPPTAVGHLVLYLGLAIAIGLWIWNRGVLQGGSGQSLGKRSTKTRLVSAATGQPIGVAMALLRDLAHLLDTFFLLGFLWPLWDEQRQTFADKVCSTLVVRT